MNAPLLPDRVLESRLIVIVPNQASGSPVAALEVLIQEGLKAVSFPASQLEQLSSLQSMFGRRAAIGLHDVADVRQVHQAAEAGAPFVLLRRPDPQAVQAAIERGLAVLPPALTPTEVQNAWDLGPTAVQVVPSDSFGGSYADYLRDLAPEATLVPRGAVGAYAASRWIAAGSPAVCVDDALTGDAFTGGQLSGLRERAQTFTDAVNS